MTYVSDDAGGVFNPSNRTVTWTFDAPTLLEQQQAANGSRTFNQTINLVTSVDNNVVNFTRLQNNVSATAYGLDGGQVSSNRSATITVSNTVNENVIFGSGFSPSHSLPTDSNGRTDQNDD